MHAIEGEDAHVCAIADAVGERIGQGLVPVVSEWWREDKVAR